VGGGAEGEQEVTLQNGGWNPEMKLYGYTGSLVADIQKKIYICPTL